MKEQSICRWATISHEDGMEELFTSLPAAIAAARKGDKAIVSVVFEPALIDLVWTPGGPSDWQWGDHRLIYEGGR